MGLVIKAMILDVDGGANTTGSGSVEHVADGSLGSCGESSLGLLTEPQDDTAVLGHDWARDEAV